ncbi:MAG: glycosyltransferase family 2 protein [Candidatus Thiodiazotropha sp. (ex Dulcina madagascariensis)]|nr:glycosyltransferase family 2 protein [Candidatus Thiodiazotropha sp. (ex Dulcina madagascariensis)]MCU7926461.1 glycosyltransferase family 2 protein [Candidatus Thiodiazotropha sp. (ex Dulcina madagascariensis)]
MDLSFIILTWNSEKYISGCLTSIINCLENSEIEYEVYIIDNGSTDKTNEIIAEYQNNYPSQIKYIGFDRNTGTTYSRNCGLREASGKFICVMDSDVVLKDGVIQRLISVLESDETAGLVVPRLVYGSGSFQKSTDNFPTLISKISRYFFLKLIDKELPDDGGDDYRAVDYAISAFWLFRRQLLDEVGYLDERIFYAPEDVDYCLRIWKYGYCIYYVNDVTAVHDAQEISRNFKFNKATYEHIKGLLYYFKKHKYLINKPIFNDN